MITEQQALHLGPWTGAATRRCRTTRRPPPRRPRPLRHRVGGGADGAYPPTKLEPDGTWSEGGDTGAFTYSYPITLPSARGSPPVGDAGV